MNVNEILTPVLGRAETIGGTKENPSYNYFLLYPRGV